MNSRQRRKLRRFSERMYVSARTQQTTAWLDERPWIDVTGDGEVPPYMMLERIPRPNDGIGPGGMQAVWDGAQETMKSIDEDRSGD